MAKKNKLERLFDQILTHKPSRTDVVKEDFEWFFPVYFHKRLEYLTAPFQMEMIKLLRDSMAKLIVITAFRGSAKTTIVAIAYTLWAVFGVQQKKHVLLVGQTEAKARRLLMNVRRQLETNSLLRRDLGPIDEEKDQWGAKAFIIRKLTIYNNNAAQTIVQIGTGTTALGTFVQRLIGDYVVNGQSERVIEDGLPEYEFEVAANVQASVAAAAPNNVQVQVEVDEYQGPNG